MTIEKVLFFIKFVSSSLSFSLSCNDKDVRLVKSNSTSPKELCNFPPLNTLKIAVAKRFQELSLNTPSLTNFDLSVSSKNSIYGIEEYIISLRIKFFHAKEYLKSSLSGSEKLCEFNQFSIYTKSSPSNEIFTGMVSSLSSASFASMENNALFPAPLRHIALFL